MTNWQNFGTEEQRPGWGTSFVRQLRIWAGLAYHSSLGGLRKLQRTQIKLVVRLAPLDVADATALSERLFQDPPKDVAEKQLRDAATTYLAKEANTKLEPDEWLTLAQILRTLRQDYQQDVLSQMVHAALHRARTKVAPPAPAKAPTHQVQSFAGLPIPGVPIFAYVSMGLAALSALLIGWVWIAETRIDRLKAENRDHKQYTKIVEEDAKRAAARAADAEARVGQANASVAETAKRAAIVGKAEVSRSERAAALRKRLEERNAKRAENPGTDDPNEWLRDLAAQPLLSASAVAAPGPAGGAGAGHSVELPGDASGTPGPSR